MVPQEERERQVMDALHGSADTGTPPTTVPCASQGPGSALRPLVLPQWLHRLFRD